jgi:transposase
MAGPVHKGGPSTPQMAIEQAVFSCGRCGHREHADVNAAPAITARRQAAET